MLDNVLIYWNSVDVTEPSAILVASIAADAFISLFVISNANLDCAIAAPALILAFAILVIELPVPSWSIVL